MNLPLRRVALLLAVLAAALLLVRALPWNAGGTADAAAQEAGAADSGPAARAEAPDEPVPGLLRTVRVDPPASAAPPATETAGSLEGRLRLADGAPPDRHEWTVRLEGPGRRWPMDAVPLAADGGFLAEGLQPGSYRVVVEQDHLPVARVEDLLVVAGQRTRDPRLLPLEPERLCHEMLVVVTGPLAQRGDLHVATIAAAGGIGGFARWVDDGRLLRAPLGEYPEVVVTAPGHTPQRLAWQDGRVEVTLQPGLAVRLRPARPVELPDGVQAWLALRPAEPLLGLEPQGFDTVFAVARLVDPGEVRLRLPAAGRYELRLASTDRQGPGFLPRFATVLGTVVVVAGAEDPVLLLDLPAPIPVVDPG